jgi:hypothetical protein
MNCRFGLLLNFLDIQCAQAPVVDQDPAIHDDISHIAPAGTMSTLGRKCGPEPSSKTKSARFPDSTDFTLTLARLYMCLRSTLWSKNCNGPLSAANAFAGWRQCSDFGRDQGTNTRCTKPMS